MPFVPGEIYLADLADGKTRPVLIVSREDLNRGNSVLVVPFTTARLEERRGWRSCVLFRPGEFGLTRECVAHGDAVFRLYSEMFHNRVGVVAPERFRDVIHALGHVIDSDCEPR